MADDSKLVFALLNGIAKRTYYNEKDISNEFLKSELFPNLSDDEFEFMVTRYTNLLKNMVSADMDLNQSEAFLTSQVKKKEGGISEEVANGFRKFWKSHKNKIHDSVIAATTWNNTLKQVSWRIDIKSQSKKVNQISTPSAIMELQIGPKDEEQKKNEVVRFELDETGLSGLLQKMQEIEHEVEKYCQK